MRMRPGRCNTTNGSGMPASKCANEETQLTAGSVSPGSRCMSPTPACQSRLAPGAAGAYNLNMESFLIFVLFLVVWFVVLPRIPGISRFT
jgi:hypothetical protein